MRFFPIFLLFSFLFLSVQPLCSARSVSVTVEIADSAPASSSAALNEASAQLDSVTSSSNRVILGYAPSWREYPFNTAMDPAVSHLSLSFVKPDLQWRAGSASFFSSGLEYRGKSPRQARAWIEKAQRDEGRKILVAVGGATYNKWDPLLAEAAGPGPITRSLIDLINDLNLDGLEIDLEVDKGSMKANAEALQKAILVFRYALDQSNSPSKLLAISCAGAGAAYVPGGKRDSGFKGKVVWFGGLAGREREVFKQPVGSGKYSGKLFGQLVDIASIMSYDADAMLDPALSYKEFRSILPASSIVLVGFEVAPEGWGKGKLVLEDSDASASVPGTIIEKDQYQNVVNLPYSANRIINAVLQDKINRRDGIMIWDLSKNDGVRIGSRQSATAKTLIGKAANMFQRG